MSNQVKPLAEQVAAKMITDLKTGNSVFQRPNNSLNSALPFNVETGKRYPGSSALVLLMQKRDDPRWGTFSQANRNHTAVNKGATGTYISFMSQYEFQKVFKDGEPVIKENGQQRTEKVRLDAPVEVEAKLFNGEQMRRIEKWEKEPNILSPAERAEVILNNSGAKIENGGDDMFYDSRMDTIVIPDKEQFANSEQFYAEALHQLAHWTAAEDRLNRPHESSQDQLTNLREELRTNIASLFLSKELNLPFELNYHEAYINSWSALLKNEPGELFKAADDAQKMVDYIMAYEKQIEQKQDVSQDKSLETGNEVSGAAVDMPVAADKLNKGEIIPHNGTEFKVLAELKNNVYQMQDLAPNGRKFKMSSNDELFKVLLDAKNNSQERVAVRENENDAAYAAGEEQQEENTYQMSR
jgi:antirestriction protein ArdC